MGVILPLTPNVIPRLREESRRRVQTLPLRQLPPSAISAQKKSTTDHRHSSSCSSPSRCPRGRLGWTPSHSVIPHPTCHSESEPRNLVARFSLSSSAIRSLPKLPLPCPRRKQGPIPFRSFPLPCPPEGGDTSPSVVPPHISSRRQGENPSPSCSSPSRCPREGGDPSSPPTSHLFPLPPCPSRRRGPIPLNPNVIPRRRRGISLQA